MRVCIAHCSCVCVLSEPLLAGLPQMVKFTLLTGHYAVKKGDALQLSNTDTMPILPSTSCTARITNPAAGQHTFSRLYLNPPITFPDNPSLCCHSFPVCSVCCEHVKKHF